MPRIPLYEEQVRPPASSQPFITSAESDVRKYREVGGLADDLLKRADQMQQQTLAIESVDAIKSFTDQWGTFMRSELQQKGRDTFGNQERASAHFENLKKDYGARLNKRVYDNIYPQLHNIRYGGIERLATHQINERQKVLVDTYQGALALGHQAIIQGVDINTMSRIINGDAQTPGILDLVDSLNPGMDNTSLKIKFEQDLWTEYLETVAIREPEAVPFVADMLRDRLPESTINKVLAKGQLTEAMRDLRDNPEAFNSALYEHLDDKTKIQLEDQAKRLADTQLRERIRKEEKAEKQAEKAEKEMRENTEVDMIIRYTRGEVGIDEIQALAQNRKVGKDMLKWFLSRDQTGTDNPMVVGDLAELIEQKVDVTDMLRDALLERQIKPSTYIQMRKQIGNDAYWKSMTRLRAALEPSIMDKWSDDKNLKWEEGFDYFNRLLAAGKTPEDAVEIVIGGHYDKVRRSASTLPKPRYLAGDEINSDTIREAINETAYRWARGDMTTTEYERETDVLNTMQELHNERMRLEEQEPERRGRKRSRPAY